MIPPPAASGASVMKLMLRPQLRRLGTAEAGFTELVLAAGLGPRVAGPQQVGG